MAEAICLLVARSLDRVVKSLLLSKTWRMCCKHSTGSCESGSVVRAVNAKKGSGMSELKKVDEK